MVYLSSWSARCWYADVTKKLPCRHAMILFISLAFPTLRQARSLDPCYFSEKLLYKNLRLVFLFRGFFLFCGATRHRHLCVFRNLWRVFVRSPSDKHAKEWSLIKFCKVVCFVLTPFFKALAALAAFIDLSGWSVLTVDLNGFGD